MNKYSRLFLTELVPFSREQKVSGEIDTSIDFGLRASPGFEGYIDNLGDIAFDYIIASMSRYKKFSLKELPSGLGSLKLEELIEGLKKELKRDNFTEYYYYMRDARFQTAWYKTALVIGLYSTEKKITLAHANQVRTYFENVWPRVHKDFIVHDGFDAFYPFNPYSLGPEGTAGIKSHNDTFYKNLASFTPVIKERVIPNARLSDGNCFEIEIGFMTCLSNEGVKKIKTYMIGARQGYFAKIEKITLQGVKA